MKKNNKLNGRLLAFQKNEITEYYIYQKLAASAKSDWNRQTLRRIGEDEFRHSQEWKKHTGAEVKPSLVMIQFYYWISRIFGLTFGIKLMERGEENVQHHYNELKAAVPEIDTLIREEEEHEQALIAMIDEERLRYMGSIVLGLNDALVELTGGLAGLTLALRNTKLIALSGSIVGIAAALSMGSSEYLSTKAEKSGRPPLRSAIYTGGAYVITVMLLILPFLLYTNPFLSLFLTLAAAVLIIAGFNYYISVTRGEAFHKQFIEMVLVSLGVAALSFGVGYVLRIFFNVAV